MLAAETSRACTPKDNINAGLQGSRVPATRLISAVFRNNYHGRTAPISSVRFGVHLSTTTPRPLYYRIPVFMQCLGDLRTQVQGNPTRAHFFGARLPPAAALAAPEFKQHVGTCFVGGLISRIGPCYSYTKEPPKLCYSCNKEPHPPPQKKNSARVRIRKPPQNSIGTYIGFYIIILLLLIIILLILIITIIIIIRGLRGLRVWVQFLRLRDSDFDKVCLGFGVWGFRLDKV